VYRIVTDQVGSLRLVVRASDGVVVQRVRHDAWGRVEEDFVAAGVARVPFGCAGGVSDGGTGLAQSGAREHDPAMGRGTARDSTRWAGGTTGLYEYVGGRPLDRVDPTGTFNPLLDTDPEDVCAVLEAMGLECPFGPTDEEGAVGVSVCEGGEAGDEPSAAATVTAKCPIEAAKGGGSTPECNGYVYGEGTAGNEEQACKIAKHNAQSNVPSGCKAKHCRCL
jgi:RHS repeat-associated protein